MRSRHFLIANSVWADDEASWSGFLMSPSWSCCCCSKAYFFASLDYHYYISLLAIFCSCVQSSFVIWPLFLHNPIFASLFVLLLLLLLFPDGGPGDDIGRHDRCYYYYYTDVYLSCLIYFFFSFLSLFPSLLRIVLELRQVPHWSAAGAWRVGDW